VAEFTSWSEKYATEAIAPVQNKVGQFLSASIIRNIVAQVKSTIDPRAIMDEGKILIVNLSKGRIGEDNMRLLGGMLITKIQMAAMERVSIPESERRDFYLYVDEFQNFANQSFANILSEARKYRLSLVVAHQYIKQLEEEVAWAVFGNVGTLIFFRVGADDATFMENEFMPTYTPEDLVNLAKYEIYLKLMVDGAATAPFSANTLAPIAQKTDNTEKVIAVSRERYAAARADIEQKVLRWSGMESSTVEYPAIETEEEQKAREELGGTPASMKPGTPEYAAAGVAALEGAASIEDTGEYLKLSPERLAAIVKAPQGQKKDKPKFPHTCTRCGKIWDMPIQLDVSRPIYCAECLPIVREERSLKTGAMRSAFRPPESGSTAVEDVAPQSKEETKLLQTFAAMEDVAPVRHADPAASQNRPRIVGERHPMPPAQKGTVKIVRADASDDSDSLLGALQRAKGKPLETAKERLTDDPRRPRQDSPRPARLVRQAAKKDPPRRPEREERKAQDSDFGAPIELDVPRRTSTSSATPPSSVTVFKPTVSAVRPHGPTTPLGPEVLGGAPPAMMGGVGSADSAPQKLTPGQRITFNE
jgi:hypothetical protein